MLKGLKHLFIRGDNKVLFSNYFSLSILQVANYILPLITLPYLIRVLGIDKYGLIIFANIIIFYFNILTDYGFNLSATRAISVSRNNWEKVSVIFSSVMYIKILLVTISFITLSLIVFNVSLLKHDWYIYYFTFGMVIGHALFPVWFFQGIEKMKYITILNITAKLIFTIAIFIFIREESDYIYVPIINSSGFIIAGLISLWIILYKYKVSISSPHFESIRKLFIDSTKLFISDLSVSLYYSTTTLILGVFTDLSYVGIYSSMEKIITALKSLFLPLYQALFPFLSKKRETDINYIIRKMISIVGLSSLAIALIVILNAEIILTVLYNQPNILQYKIILQILAMIIFFGAINMLFNYLYLSSIKAYRERMYIMLCCGIINILSVSIMTYYFNIYGTAVAITCTELLLLLFGIYYYRKLSSKLSLSI